VSLFAIAFAFWGAFDHTVLPIIIGPASNNMIQGDQNPLLDISLLSVHSAISPYLVAFIISGLVFASISTTNTFLNVCSHSFTSDILVGSLANKSLANLQPAENSFYVRVARITIIGLVLLIFTCFVVLTTSGLLADPLSFFFIAYSVQFALLAPMIMSALPRRWRPSSTAALWSLYLGFATALVIGFGMWLLIQTGDKPILSLAPSDWLTLAPVVTIGLGFAPLLVDSARR
jgi:Na+/proline symporter